MKILSFNEFLNENVDVNRSVKVGDTVYHTSYEENLQLRDDYPMWFSLDSKTADDWHEINKDLKQTYTYELKITSGNFLSRDEAYDLCRKLKISFNNIEEDLVNNPKDVLKIKNISRMKKHCDGFLHIDYDPSDPQKDTRSLFIFQPKKCLEILKRHK